MCISRYRSFSASLSDDSWIHVEVGVVSGVTLFLTRRAMRPTPEFQPFRKNASQRQAQPSATQIRFQVGFRIERSIASTAL
jgi:hypothetical protein